MKAPKGPTYTRAHALEWARKKHPSCAWEIKATRDDDGVEIWLLTGVSGGTSGNPWRADLPPVTHILRRNNL